jgi:hypothetical protein
MGVARSLYIRPCMLWVAGFGADKKGFVFGIVVGVAFFLGWGRISCRVGVANVYTRELVSVSHVLDHYTPRNNISSQRSRSSCDRVM